MNEHEHEQANATIASALGAQAHKIASRARRDVADRESLRSGAVAPVVTPHNCLRNALEPLLGHWDRVKQHPLCGAPDGSHFLPRALASVDLVKSLLQKLDADGKAGERADATRRELQSDLEELTAAIDHFRSLGTTLQGHLALELEQKIVDCRSAQVAAYNAKANAVTRDEMREALLDIELAEASVRAADKAIAEAVRGLAVRPSLHSEQAVRDAEAATAALECLPRKPSASQIKNAILEGERDGAQSYYACFEKTPLHPLCEWRWRGATGT